MASLSQTILSNLKAEKNLAIQSGNKVRLDYLNFKIEELESLILKAQDEDLRLEMGLK